MSRNINITPQRSKPVVPLTSDSKADTAASSVVIDEQTYWTGKDYSITMENRNPHTRWYRIVVTNLKRNEDYSLFMADGRQDEDYLLEADPGKELAFSLVFGGDTGREPEVPKQFDVYLQEFARPDEQGQMQVVHEEHLKWIPRPNAMTIGLKLPVTEIKVRPWPWKQHVKFEASLLNRSYLPIQAEVRALPDEESKKEGLEGTQEKLIEPVPPLREQPVLCEILLEKKLTAPVILTVDATAAIPALGMEVVTAPQAFQIVPVGFLKMWQDWAVILATAFLLFWALFGMPPFVPISTEVVLTFDKDVANTPNLKSALTVTLTPVKTDGKNPPDALQAVTGEPEPPGKDPKQLAYTFHWGTRWRGFRWGWDDYKLHLTLKPADGDDNPFSRIKEREIDLDNATISTGHGVNPASMTQAIHFTTFKPAIVTIPSGTPLAPFSYTVTDDQDRRITSSISNDGGAVSVKVPMDTQKRTVTVRVDVNGNPRKSNILEIVSDQPKDFGAWTSKDDDSGKKDDQVEAARKAAEAQKLAEQKAAEAKKAEEAKKLADAQKGTQNQNKNQGTTLPTETPPDPAIPRWCTLLGVPSFGSILTKESSPKTALKVTTRISSAPDSTAAKPKVVISIQTNYNCWYQLFDVPKDPAQITCVFLDKDRNLNMTGQPISDCRPVYLAAGVPFDYPSSVEGGYVQVVVLAQRGEANRPYTSDLLSLLKKSTGEGFAISGAVWP